jgi:hypothetical protein
VTVSIAAGPINDLATGTSTVTLYDGADAYGWTSFSAVRSRHRPRGRRGAGFRQCARRSPKAISLACAVIS